MKLLKLFGAATGAVLTAIGVAPACAQSVTDFYKGNTVTIIIGSSAGGGFDLYGRLIGRHMSKHLPGSPNVVASNMPGAGSIRLAQHIYNVAPRDGTVIGAIVGGMVGNEYGRSPSHIEQRQVCRMVPQQVQQGETVTFSYRGRIFTQSFGN